MATGRLWILLVPLAGCAGCAGESRDPAGVADGQGRTEFVEWLGFEPPASAKLDVIEPLWRASRALPHESDGGGSWRLVEASEAIRAGGSARLGFEYTVGPEGVAEGGAIHLQAPPFWGWSTPQVQLPDGLGFTTVTTDARGVELEPRTVDEQLLAIRVTGRALAPGERVRIVYGDGPAGARADRFAEEASRFVLAVDGDGDGFRLQVDPPLAVAVGPGPPARLLVHLPATARPAETVELRAALVDGRGNRAPVRSEARIELEWEDGRVLEARLVGPGEDAWSWSVGAGEGGTRRATARWLDSDGEVLLEASSNPMRVSTARRVLWADLQGHSSLSDGTGEPEQWFAYAREVGALDLVALTDHDHWGLRPIDEHPELWQRILDAADAADVPGRFLALAGFEWTSWIFGHRHVVYFGDERPLLSSFDRATDEPQELWAALEGLDALSIPHTLAGGPVAVDWSLAPNPRVEPVVELVSVHGASDAPDSPRRIYSSVDGHWFTDVLDRGYRYGVVGSTDGHDGHPGLAHLAAPSGGLAGILAEQATRASVLEALRARRTFATSGPRILVRTSLAGQPMGAGVPLEELGPNPSLFVEAFGTGPLERVEVLDAAGAWLALELDGALEVREALPLPMPEPGDVLWVRVIQEDRHAAWTSPYRFE